MNGQYEHHSLIQRLNNTIQQTVNLKSTMSFAARISNQVRMQELLLVSLHGRNVRLRGHDDRVS